MNRTLGRITVVAAAVGVSAALMPATATAAPVSATNCANLSTKAAPNGWGNTFSDEAGQAGTHTAATVLDEDGSLDLTTSTGTGGKKRMASYHAAGGVDLAVILKEKLTFEKKGANVNWQIRASGADTVNPPATDENGFVTFVWSATKNGLNDATESNQWWATRDLPGISKGARTTLAELAAAAGEDTVVDHYGVSSQPAAADVGDTALVDNVSFNGCTTNFAESAPGGNGSADGNGSLGGLSLTSLLPF